ncbi:MAG: discoidin domain-containing protein, partial [Gemmatimonadetes bacterium]|nr:discoidin domain-containing protein [Gemmatimonadota bacterium]
MFKWRFRLLICILLSARAASAVDVWTAGGSGFAWDDVGELTGLTSALALMLPAVVDSTTNAVENLTLTRRGGNISSPQSRENLTGLLTDGNAETFWRVTRERRPDGTSMVIDLGAILPINRIRFQGNPDIFLRAYELFVHDGNPAQLRDDRPIAFINKVSANLEQSESDIDAHIPLQFVRFIRLISRSGQEFIIEEVEVFG